MYTNSITSTVDGIKTIKTIFDWKADWDVAKRHTLSHCLLRIYVNIPTNRAVIIASEIESNRANIDIGHDFEGLASSVVKEFGAELSVPLSQVIWIQHYGRFSEPRSYENLGMRDRFSQIHLPMVGEKLEGKGKQTVLSSTKVQELMGWLDLEPVEEVLQKL